MTEEVLAHLKEALSDRYTIEREVGSGGMATVYLAEDVKHHRKVAVKVGSFSRLWAIYASIRGDDVALTFFKDRQIKWWRATASGDSRDLDGPTRNFQARNSTG